MRRVSVEVGRLERFEVESGLVGYRSPLLSELGVPHAFTTRHDGGGLALEIDGRDGSRGSEGRLHRLVQCDDVRPLLRVRQVHADGVYRVVKPFDSLRSATPPDADALVSKQKDGLLIIRVADCVPILLASCDGEMVAAIHAGWRGMVAGVIEQTVSAFEGREIVAAIGASISLRAFEVGPEVAQAFRSTELAEVIHPGREDRSHIDLRAAAKLQLERAGVIGIDSTDRCTFRDESEFHSYRRDVTGGAAESTGRMGAVIGRPSV
ncbi:MAG: YfiH family protein [Planctomycetota bacterium]|jgi:YfiH family protein